MFISGRPFVLRDAARPFKNLLEYRGIDPERLEQMEARLRVGGGWGCEEGVCMCERERVSMLVCVCVRALMVCVCWGARVVLQVQTQTHG